MQSRFGASLATYNRAKLRDELGQFTATMDLAPVEARIMAQTLDAAVRPADQRIREMTEFYGGTSTGRGISLEMSPKEALRRIKKAMKPLAPEVSDVKASDVAASSHGSLRSADSYSGAIHRAATLRDYAERTAEELRARRGEYDFVAVTGQSGMSVAFAALMFYDFPLVVVRKGERTHGTMIEGDAERVGRYIVVDDFISSGSTLRRINKELCEWAVARGHATPEHVGSWLYTRSRFDKQVYTHADSRR